MSDCPHQGATVSGAPVNAGDAHCSVPAETVDSCCAEPARTDYFLWACVILVAMAYGYSALQSGHRHDSVIAVFTDGIFELFNLIFKK